MLTIDGARGEGGGQLVRSSLALSLVTGRPVRIVHIRARRKNPGLARQHLTAVRAAVEVGAAECSGAALGSDRLEFHPTAVRGGTFRFDVGSAGSCTLVLQTVLPALMLADASSTITLQGGTHNPLAPPFEFLARGYVPLVERMGPRFSLQLERHGFFPAGGGELRLTVHPAARLERLQLRERGALRERRVRCLLAQLPDHVSEREWKTLRRLTGWPASCFALEPIADSRGPGNVLLAELEFEHVTEVFCAFGKRGLPAEKVARLLHREVQEYLRATAPVGPHLADQLLLPLAIGAHRHASGGSFRTTALTGHTTTHIDLLRMFLDIQLETHALGDRDFLIEVGKADA